MTTTDTQKLIQTSEHKFSAYKLGANENANAQTVGILEAGTPQEVWVAFFHVPAGTNPLIRAHMTEAEIQAEITQFLIHKTEVPQCLSDALEQIQAIRADYSRKITSPPAPALRR